MATSGSEQGIWVNIGLFVATCVTTVWAGHQSFGSWAGGAAFGGTLMAILVCHEAGHFLMARRYRIDASLPYFIPLPPLVSWGTLGAVIRMREPIADRNQLIDVGAAGPIAGLAVAAPLLIIGLWLSPLAPSQPGGLLEGNSLLYLGLKYLVFGRYLPGDEAGGGIDVNLHPMAFAAWVGLLITMINLIPIGQLDGGHVACAFLGDRHEEWSRWVHRSLIVMAALVLAWLVWEGRKAGLGATAALWHGGRGGMPWLLWAGLLAGMRSMGGGVYHPPVAQTPLTPGRRGLVVAIAVIFVLILTPAPLRPVL